MRLVGDFWERIHIVYLLIYMICAPLEQPLFAVETLLSTVGAAAQEQLRGPSMSTILVPLQHALGK